MNWHDGKSIAEIIYEYGAVRGDLGEKYARDQLVSIIEGRIAELFAPLVEQARQEGAREALRAAAEEIRASHPRVTLPEHHQRFQPDHPGVCGTCWARKKRTGFEVWPCPTIAALDRAERAATPGSRTAGGGT